MGLEFMLTFLLLAFVYNMGGISMSMAREAPIFDHPSHHHHLTLPARLAAAGGAGDCWSALVQLRSCTNEIVLFFLNGESYLGMDCCRAIRVITHDCWPSLLSSIGFDAEEGDILRGYCDASVAHDGPQPLEPATAPTNAICN